MAWWLWLVLGLALLASEAFTPGTFFVFFFGLSAIAVGLAVWLGPTSRAGSSGSSSRCSPSSRWPSCAARS